MSLYLWIALLIFLGLGLYGYYRFFLVYRAYKSPPSLKERKIEIEGFQLNYIDIGKGAPLLLLHGIGASHFLWRKVIPLLKEDYRVIALDLPGFGSSSKKPAFSHSLEGQEKVLISFLEKLKIKRASIAGSSMGATIALWLKRKHPDDFNKIIAISPAANPEHTKNIRLKRFRAFTGPAQLFLNPFVIKTILSRVLNNKENISPEVIAQYFRPYKEEKESIACFIKAFDNLLADSRLPEIFKDIEDRVDILWGTKDRITPIRYAKELEKVLPNCKLHFLEGGSHHFMEEDAKWTAKKIREILGEG